MNYQHIVVLKVRIADINYGQHLGHVELINLLHEVRMDFLNLYSVNEIDIDGYGLVMQKLNVMYKHQAFWGDELRIKMQMKAAKARIIFDYVVDNLTIGNETAIAETTMVLIDKKTHRPIRPNVSLKIQKIFQIGPIKE